MLFDEKAMNDIVSAAATGAPPADNEGAKQAAPSENKRWWQSSVFDFQSDECRIKWALESLAEGSRIEVEGQSHDIVAGRSFSSSGGDWQSATLQKIDGSRAKIEYSDIYEDEEGLELMKEWVPLRLTRPVQPKHDEGLFNPRPGEQVDARLPDEDGLSKIWYVCSIKTVDQTRKRAYRVVRKETGEKNWVSLSKLRPSRSWCGTDKWVIRGKEESVMPAKAGGSSSEAVNGELVIVELRTEDRARFLGKMEGGNVEVEGYPPDSCGERTFTSTGGDWQVCKLVTIEGMRAEVEHADVFEDEEGTVKLKEWVALRSVRPVQPPQTRAKSSDSESDKAASPMLSLLKSLKVGDDIDAKLPDEEGEPDIWWACKVKAVEVNEDEGAGNLSADAGMGFGGEDVGGFGRSTEGRVQVYRMDEESSQEQVEWVDNLSKLRPSRIWQGSDLWLPTYAHLKNSKKRLANDELWDKIVGKMGGTKEGERTTAVLRALDFVYRLASNRQNFTEFGADMVQCFYDVATIAPEPVRQKSIKYVEECSQWWKERNDGARFRPAAASAAPSPRNPGGSPRANGEEGGATTVAEVVDAIMGTYSLERVGIHHPLKLQLLSFVRKSSSGFSVTDYLQFDPKVSPPPREAQSGESVYRILSNALSVSFYADGVGVDIGCNLVHALKHVPRLRPYQGPKLGLTWELFIDQVNSMLISHSSVLACCRPATGLLAAIATAAAVKSLNSCWSLTHCCHSHTAATHTLLSLTHCCCRLQCFLVFNIVHVLSNYGELKLSKRMLPHEWHFVRSRETFNAAVEQQDMHIISGLLHCNRIFGVKDDDSLMEKHVAMVLKAQKQDGSFKANDDEAYTRYHAANCCIMALVVPAFRGSGPSNKEVSSAVSCPVLLLSPLLPAVVLCCAMLLAMQVLEEVRRWHRLQPALGSLALSADRVLAPCGVQHSAHFAKKFKHVREDYERSAASELDISAEHMPLVRYGKVRLKALLRYRERQRLGELTEEKRHGDVGDEEYVPASSGGGSSGGSGSRVGQARQAERVQAKGGWARAGAKKASAALALTGGTGFEALKNVAARMTTAVEFGEELNKYCDRIGRQHYMPPGDPRVMMAGASVSLHKLFHRIVTRAKSQRKGFAQFDYADWGTVVKCMDVPTSIPDRVSAARVLSC
jgi:hypothetical protein